MVRINKVRFAGWIVLLLAVLWLGGCTTAMQARSAFEEAELLADEENYDLAIEKYAEAIELEPSSKTYRLKMVSAKTRAAATHIRRARALKEEGKYSEAVEEYRIAEGFDQSVEVAAQEANELLQLIEAQKLAEEGASFWGTGKLLPARKAIEKSLKLDPQNARALAIKDLIERDQKKISMDGIELDVASEEPITLSFKDADIKEVFGILSQLSGINFIFDEEIRDQSISVLLEKASFLQAMELILQMNALDKKVLNGKTIIIYPQSREKNKQYDDQIIQTFYLSHIDAKKAVNLLRTMLQLRKIYVHEERNAIVVRDKPEVIKLAEQILQAADRSDSEVLFDVEVLAVRDTDNLNFGPKLSTYSTKVGFGAVTGADGVIGAIPDSIVTQSLSGLETFYTVPSATFDYAKTLSTTELLASPKIRVKNNEKAKVHIGKRDPIVTTTQVGTSDSTTQNVQYVDSGIKLDIEPTVQLDGTVLTKITLEVSTAERLDSTDTTGESPIALTTTNAQTSLVLLDGARTILGGLFEDNTSSTKTTFPFLGEIPFLGDLFSNFSNFEEKREIILSITPYIIKKVELPDVDIATIWSGGEDDLKDGPNFGSFAQPLLSEVEATQPRTSPAAKPPQLKMTSDDEAPSLNETPVPTQPIVPTEQVMPPVEAVPLEVLTEQVEIGAPIVLPMPEKAPASINFSGPKEVKKGSEFSLAVQVKDVEQLYSAPLFVKYDPAILELMSLNEGVFLKQDGQSTVFSSSPNRTTGQVIVGYKQGTGGKGASGAGVLFNLNFKALTEGETTLEVNRVNFRNPEGVRLQVAPEPVTIEIR
ncbi:cohesin domain-containing protein [Deltaproteobacteria bacterium IMCC39524]|nr:cohesin domain-containing protein [Deltaproteobacteria bacterium IMCC39524]